MDAKALPRPAPRASQPPASPSRSHDPAEAVALLLEKLGQPRRHLSILLGAGASIAVGLPDLVKLGKDVRGELSAPHRTEYIRLTKQRDLEAFLSYLRTVRALLASSGTSFDGMTSDSATELDRAVTRAIATILSRAPAASEAHERLAAWLGRSPRPSAVEVFTTNYDLVLESALDATGVPYFDGFVGLFRGHFRPDLIEPDEPGGREQPPVGWVRLWKLHGSVSWVIDDASKRISRLASAGVPESPSLSIHRPRSTKSLGECPSSPSTTGSDGPYPLRRARPSPSATRSATSTSMS
jgi:hypothetical protein